jgi:hypothetical protein
LIRSLSGVCAVLLLLAPACSNDRAPASSEFPRSPEQLSEEERAALDDRMRRDLSVARERKKAMTNANVHVLDALPTFPGSKLLEQRDNPESDGTIDESKEAAELELYASELLSTDAFLTLTAGGWGTFRTYSVPRGTQTQEVYAFFRTALADWRLVLDERDFRGDGETAIYLPMYQRSDRCLWLHIGTVTGPELREEVGPGLSFEVATSLLQAGEEGC